MGVVLLLSTNTPDTIDDDEFGSIRIRRNARARHVRLVMGTQGDISISLPRFAAKRYALELLDQSRNDIRAWRQKHRPMTNALTNGQRLGHSHTIRIESTTQTSPQVHIEGLTVVIEMPWGKSFSDPKVREAILPIVKKVLTIEAKAYLPRQLAYLANQYDFTYKKTRFGAPRGRWGSCSSSGTISMNVSLMALDDELIDYVLVHELCHTKQMNHSRAFWQLVESCLPDYRERRKKLKKIQPII